MSGSLENIALSYAYFALCLYYVFSIDMIQVIKLTFVVVTQSQIRIKDNLRAIILSFHYYH